MERGVIIFEVDLEEDNLKIMQLNSLTPKGPNVHTADRLVLGSITKSPFILQFLKLL
jgi:hypothetical protein